MARSSLTSEAVDKAIAEFDAMGRKAFLDFYGFKGAKDYYLVINGKNYDSKAIVAVAHKFLPGDGKPLRHDELSGGVSDAAGKLRALGLEVTTPGENADWSWDEHVLALEVYMAHPHSTPGKTSREVLELSELLNELGRRAGVARTAKFRNANGVYMKLTNLRQHDPVFQATGKVGLPRGAKGEKAVWDAYANDPVGLKAAAAAIRLAIEDETVELDQPEDGYEADESKVVLRLHRSRERDRKLIEKKKKQALASAGALICEVCAFDFSRRYGEHGRDFIEAHHIKPVSTLVKGEKTRLSDLALVCANCHRMLHRGRSLLTLSSLKGVLQTS